MKNLTRSLVWEQLDMIRGGQMPLSIVWRTPRLWFSRRSGAGSVHSTKMLPPSPPQTPPINPSTGSTDLQESGNQQLHVQMLKMQKITICWEQASSSLIRRTNYWVHTFLSPQLHINLPDCILRQDQSS